MNAQQRFIQSRWRLDAVFNIEREIAGLTAEAHRVIRQERSAVLMEELHAWLIAQPAKLSRNHDLAKASTDMLRRWPAFIRFLDDGRVCITNNAAERALCCVPLGRKAWLFCGWNRGGQRAAVIHTLIGTARLNDMESASLARRRPGSHRRASGQLAWRIAALELTLAARDRGLTMHINKVYPSGRWPSS